MALELRASFAPIQCRDPCAVANTSKKPLKRIVRTIPFDLLFKRLLSQVDAFYLPNLWRR